ncbi:MAG: hypothetical protein Ct9H300mP32_3670 [Verrucomicrobiota bacterium]|nr:MAG: hypothetical protein Ct9H300mP32_3670 [Verrucomicrobiota bacterium]
MISLWPVRTGLVVDAGVVYAAAGLYPSQGVHAVALDASDGSTVFGGRNSTSPAGLFAGVPKRCSSSRPAGATPSGSTAKRGAWPRRSAARAAHSRCCSRGNLFSGTGNDGTLTANPVQSSSGRLATFKGNALAASPRYSFMLDETGVRAIDRQAYRRASAKPNVPHGDRVAEGRAQKNRTLTRAPHRAAAPVGGAGRNARRCQAGEGGDRAMERISVLRRHTIIALANCVVVGGDDLIEARSLVDGSVQWTAKVDGTARGLAFPGGRLLVSTDTGMLHCFSTALLQKQFPKPPAGDPPGLA